MISPVYFVYFMLQISWVYEAFILITFSWLLYKYQELRRFNSMVSVVLDEFPNSVYGYVDSLTVPSNTYRHVS